MKITDNLNPQQLAAVTAEDQHLLVIAGAGSGKTRVLVSRVAWLMAEKGVSPREIMAVTFTNKAANEMKERIEAMTGQPAGRMWIGTFHSLCARLLRIEAEALDLAPNFIIYDDSDCKRLMKDIIAELALPDSDKRYAPAAILFAISEAKNRLQSAAEYAADAADEWQRNIARAYRLYQQKLKANGALDFDDLLVKGVQLLDTCPEVREKYQQRFRHILVDEYQDTNRCQYRLVQLLAGKSGNLFVVGDPDQSIYRWRGADINNILDFTDDYPRCREIQLNRNYRSTQNILDVANSVIAHNKRRKEKRLDTENGSGERVIFRFSETDREEAAFVIRTIARLVEQGDYRYADCAVLYRTHGLSRLFEDECTRFHIPYRVYGGMKFYDRKEVRDLYAYLRLAANPNDAEALQRIYNVPRRGIGATTWQKVQEAAAASGQPLYAVLAQAAQLEGVSAATGKKLTSLHQLLASFAEFAAADATISDLLEKIWQESGYHDMLREQENYQEKLEIIEQLFDVAADFDASWAEMQALMEEGEFDTPLSAFLSQLALATDMDDEHQAESFVTLMTMHAAKGLEYPVVFIVGMEEGGFPHERALTGVDDSEMEEERRLCYVAMTRAKERLFLSAAGRRLIWGSLQNRLVSSFIDEVGEGLLDKQGFITRARAEQSVEKRREVQTSIFTGRTYGSSGGSRPAAPAPTPARPAASAPQPAAKPAAPAAPIALGDKVLHGKFGEGTVVAVQGSGDDLMVTVAFPGQGIKTLMWRFAPMKKI